MVIERPQIEQSELTKYIPPKGEFDTFRDEDHYKEKLKEWGLSSAKEAKREFWYKDRNYQRLVSIRGYETYGSAAEFNTIVIEFNDGQLSCIHPAYLKEMQQSSFGKESLLNLEDNDIPTVESDSNKEDSSPALSKTSAVKELPKTEAEPKPKQAKVKETKPKKEKAPKLELPAEKVHFTATVKQFALTYNPFNEENDEVVVLEDVKIIQDNPIEVGFAWCSHSKTLKKFELAVGDKLEFDGKVAAKKLAKGKDVEEEFLVDVPVLYKVNNPSKIVKN
ncbi:hypothetical protein AA0X95_17810 [Bacillus sp. 1P10SD]|uniref:hypothetical protein n=1 Tax=Bacillus sp. 1P10SD TaxID=3132265 RepID=UPI0039A68A8B